MTLAFDSAYRRQFVAVLALSRFLETSINLAEGTGTVPKIAYKDFYMWLGANLLTQYFLSCEKDVLNGGIKSFYVHWAQMTPNDKIQVEVWHRMRADNKAW